MDDVKEVDADTRQGLRILADSTKLKGTEGVARKLNKAAESGSQSDYDQAETIFMKILGKTIIWKVFWLL